MSNHYFINPNDDTEVARLQLQDNLFNEVVEEVPKQFTPFNGAKILDLACGPGGWALQVAQAYPQCAVTGVDNNPRMIEYANAQAETRELDVQFRIMDILKPWDFANNSFDLINIRFMTGFTPVSSLLPLFQECWRVLRPKGVLRNTETVYMSTPASLAMQKLGTIIHEAVYMANLSFSPYNMSNNPIIKKILKEVGFKQFILVPYIIDLSSGELMHRPMKDDLVMSSKLLKPFVTQRKLCSPEEFDSLIDEYAQDWDSSNFCAHWYLCSLEAVKQAEKQIPISDR